MTHHTGNLGSSERVVSGALGLALATLGVFGRGGLIRTAGTAAGLMLLSRAIGGHCGLKAALKGETTLREGMSDQMHALQECARQIRSRLQAERVTRSHARSRFDAVDEAVLESFPASDPPASRLPDEPPVNASAKWEAARKAT